MPLLADGIRERGVYTAQADEAVEMKFGRNFDKMRRVLARRVLSGARRDRRMGNHVDAPTTAARAHAARARAETPGDR
ncbi:hypothetical protein [Burkholderia multivorans]|uniref:hypothetical protein n=1 Tax=Burkholderia multivorans TaxID=87883 RepID=UPI0015612EC6|nr:hypothetical protein [Burkholderia multivorans]MCO1341986.1 hypothetical protein [Burkholderia multivorans]MCO1440960.1 hypothetical protein [Burkholderia multivorans]UQO32230.1 hypothetical protein L0Z21_22270 [Burkholderia multivorans]UQO45370.1 hypothetical protein L0Z43_22005 [Burkholderia multivorans]